MSILQTDHVKRIIWEMHKRMQAKFERNTSENTRFLLANQLNSLLCLNPEAGPIVLSKLLKKHYGLDVDTEEIIHTLRSEYLGYPEERRLLFLWVRNIVGDFAKAMQGDKAAMERFVSTKSTVPQGTGSRRHCQERLVIIGIFTLLRDIDTFGDFNNLLLMGNTKARYCLYDAEDAIANEYGFVSGSKKKNIGTKDKDDKKALSYEQLLLKSEQQEALIERTNAMLKDLQDEFDEQITESKVQELTDFFSKLNSNSYGRIIDELFVLRKGINTLRKAHYELPEAVNGLMIMSIKMLQFIKDSHIDPIMKVGAVLQVKAKDIEDCVYEGSAFVNNDEVKNVKVISPGWVYRDKNIQISRPQVKEVE